MTNLGQPRLIYSAPNMTNSCCLRTQNDLPCSHIYIAHTKHPTTLTYYISRQTCISHWCWSKRTRSALSLAREFDADHESNFPLAYRSKFPARIERSMYYMVCDVLFICTYIHTTSNCSRTAFASGFSLCLSL